MSQGRLGTESHPLDGEGDLLQLETFTEDPANTAEGEFWLREDLTDAGEGKIGEFRWDTGSGVQGFGIYDTAEAVTEDVTALRVFINSVTGYVPLRAFEDDPASEALRFRHGGETLGFGRLAIPDSEGLHARFSFDEYDTTQTSNFEDLSGNSHDLVNGTISGCGESINGVQAGELDGVDDGVWTDTFANIYPATYHIVARLDDANSVQMLLQALSNNPNHFRWNDDGWYINIHGDSDVTGSNDSSVLLFTLQYASTSILREGGSQTGSADTSGMTEEIDQVGIGSENPLDDRRHWDGAIGEVLVYPSARTATEIEEAEGYLADKWGISI